MRWANGLHEAGVEVHLITQHPELESVAEGIQVHHFPFRGVLGYFRMVPAVRKLLKRLQPDLVNAHYASGYGTTARLARYRPCLLSVWGSDVYDVPFKSRLHRHLIRQNIQWADAVASTSHAMAKQVHSFVPFLEEIAITPFGVDIEAFSGQTYSLNERAAGTPLVIGTVKKLAPKYGVDTLLKAFAIVRQHCLNAAPSSEPNLQLRLVGDGPDRRALEDLAETLGIAHVTEFLGRIPHDTVPRELAGMDIFAALSREDSESFGVAAIEAGAARRPVVVSDAGGLPEVVRDGETGLIVPRENPEAAAEALTQLVQDGKLRLRMGEAGAAHVARQYDWAASVNTMLEVYRKTVMNRHSQTRR
ncbi:glycosyltransferase family 4 protein [Gammaproteobacteria bacterium 2W06]|nr:glycosyltransferase family 4 protein [Gammaproteobacteria bacterium 2W06]